MSIREQFASNLRYCRRLAGVSQEEVAWRASLHRTQIGSLERGDRLPRIDTVAKLAGALEVSPCDLLDGIVWRPGEHRPGGFTP